MGKYLAQGHNVPAEPIEVHVSWQRANSFLFGLTQFKADKPLLPQFTPLHAALIYGFLSSDICLNNNLS